jgi:DNA-binding transcriptional LysR family regulator
MEIATLKILVEVMRAGSFAAVARMHEVDPSSISRTIAILEDELGFRLFQRTTRRLAATEAGTLYFERMQPIIDEMDRVGQEARDIVAEPAGRLRVTASVSFGHTVLVPLLPRLRSAYPDLSIDLILTDAVLDLINEKIDVALRLGPRIDTGLIGTQLMRTRYHVCASPGYLKSAPKLRAPPDLSDHGCVLFPYPGYRSQWRFRARNGEVTEVPVNGAITISNALALQRAALDGLGPVLLADWLIRKDLQHGKLVDVLPKYEATATDFDTAAWVLYPSRAYVPRKVRAFIDLLKSHTKAARGRRLSG